MNLKTKTPWYLAGLHFKCQRCGNCCCGPQEGYIWLIQREVELIADMLRISAEQALQKYCRRIGFRISLIERQDNKDCVFLRNENGCKRCLIYNVRPGQCRKWPFWLKNIDTADTWNKAAEECPGINHGRLYNFEEIQKLIGATE